MLARTQIGASIPASRRPVLRPREPTRRGFGGSHQNDIFTLDGRKRLIIIPTGREDKRLRVAARRLHEAEQLNVAILPHMILA